MRRKPAGRLELTWMGKDSALIPVEDGKYDYAWVSPEDPRVREVRTIKVNKTVGNANGPTGAKENLLITGESADALRSLGSIPEYAEKYLGKVKLVYIDPPFNTEQAFEHYADQLEHSVWLTMMRDRIRLIKPLMAPDASIWVHLDDREVHRMRLLLDEELGAENFIAEVVWQKVYTVKNSAKHLSKDHDVILLYAMNKSIWQRNRLPRTAEMDSRYINPDNDPRGPWKAKPLHANKPYSRGVYQITTPSGRVIGGPPPGTFWRISKEELQRLDSDGQIWWGSEGTGTPNSKTYLHEVEGKIPQTIWPFSEVGHNDQAKREIQVLLPTVIPFSTPKPERLLQRILQIGSQPGDLILDCFSGSGTTAAVAHKMGRKWVAIELLSKTVNDYIVPRLTKVIAGEDKGGISVFKERVPVEPLPGGLSPAEAREFNSLLAKVVKDCKTELDPETIRTLRSVTRTKEVTATNWSGGGGFTIANLGPSMYEVNEDLKMTFLSDAATNGPWSISLAAQLGFKLIDHPVFVGSKGRQRLAVIDGVVDTQVVRTIVENLEAEERTVIVGKASLAGVDQLLTSLSKGSKLLVAPDDLFPKGTVV